KARPRPSLQSQMQNATSAICKPCAPTTASDARSARPRPVKTGDAYEGRDSGAFGLPGHASQDREILAHEGGPAGKRAVQNAGAAASAPSSTLNGPSSTLSASASRASV